MLLLLYTATAASDQGNLIEPASSGDLPTSVSPPERPTKVPFDDQTFDLEIQSFVWDENDLVLNVNEQQLGMDTDFQTL